jgi:hypothetical protein
MSNASFHIKKKDKLQHPHNFSNVNDKEITNK